MNIREIQLTDIPQLVVMDHKSYGEYGASEEYFRQKLESPNTRIIVVEVDDKVTGFTVFEVMKQDEIPESFSDLSLKEPLKGKWMHIIAFTTETNYKDVESDSELLLTSEEMARNMGCATFCVPLSTDHPHPEAFPFFEGNGYQRRGTIKWIVNPSEKIDCYFYSKPAQVNRV